MRLWAKIWKDGRLLKDITISHKEDALNRTRKVFQSLREVCYEFDLPEPLWLDSNIEEFKRRDKTRFTQDNFIETIDFNYLEIQVIEE